MWRVISYIDGFNLYYGLMQSGLCRYLWLNLQDMSASLLKPNYTLVGTKYFTARVSSPPDKVRRQNTFLEALGTLDRTDVFYGHFLRKTIKCNNCQYTFSKHEEKMSDVNLATQMLTDAFQDRFDTALVISADSDLAAPIEVVRRHFASKRVIVATPPGRHSTHLQKLANAYFSIHVDNISRHQFPHVVTKSDGTRLIRPREWR